LHPRSCFGKFGFFYLWLNKKPLFILTCEKPLHECSGILKFTKDAIITWQCFLHLTYHIIPPSPKITLLSWRFRLAVLTMNLKIGGMLRYHPSLLIGCFADYYSLGFSKTFRVTRRTLVRHFLSERDWMMDRSGLEPEASCSLETKPSAQSFL